MKKFLTAVMIVLAVANFAYSQSITFKLIMSKQIALNNFNPATDTVWVRGSFNGWDQSTPMTKPSGSDSVYTATVANAGTVNSTAYFKYMFQHAGADKWEDDPNREAIVNTGATVLDPVYFNRQAWETLYNIQTSFAVNMELERLSGRFHPATDTISVNGSFNGWSSKVDIMTPGSNADIYEKTSTVSAAVGSTIQFKYWYTPNNWESIANRMYTYTQTDATAGFAIANEGSFNNGTLESVTNQPCTIKFTVNVATAKDVNGIPFTSVDNVIICGSSSPLGWPGGGWPTSDSAVVIKLYNDGTHGDAVANDKIWSKDITFPAYTSLGVEYKYGINFGLANNGGANDNERGVGSNHTLPWLKTYTKATAVDTFGVIKLANLINITTDVRELPGTNPTAFDMSQNYPNPFNPSTSINFTIPSNEFVTISLYNILGQEVAKLMNEEKSAGRYQVNFDAAKLASGTYFYTIKAGHWTATKKMTLLK